MHSNKYLKSSSKKLLKTNKQHIVTHWHAQLNQTFLHFNFLYVLDIVLKISFFLVSS